MVFFKISKNGLSTCFWVLFTVHRFVSSRVTVVAPSKRAQLNIQVTKARSGLPTACNGQPHQEAEGMPRATKCWLRTAGTPGVSACDNEAREAMPASTPPLKWQHVCGFPLPRLLAGWLQTGPGAFASQLSRALLGRWGLAWPSSPHTVPWLSTAPAERAPWCHHPPRCSPRPLTG